MVRIVVAPSCSFRRSNRVPQRSPPGSWVRTRWSQLSLPSVCIDPESARNLSVMPAHAVGAPGATDDPPSRDAWAAAPRERHGPRRRVSHQIRSSAASNRTYRPSRTCGMRLARASARTHDRGTFSRAAAPFASRSGVPSLGTSLGGATHRSTAASPGTMIASSDKNAACLLGALRPLRHVGQGRLRQRRPPLATASCDRGH
jgi:hypothetical protein